MEDIWKIYNNVLNDSTLIDAKSSQLESNVTICKYCSSHSNIIHDTVNGNIICSNCGTVNEENVIDDSAEWRSALARRVRR